MAFSGLKLYVLYFIFDLFVVILFYAQHAHSLWVPVNVQVIYEKEVKNKKIPGISDQRVCVTVADLLLRWCKEYLAISQHISLRVRSSFLPAESEFQLILLVTSWGLGHQSLQILLRWKFCKTIVVYWYYDFIGLLKPKEQVFLSFQRGLLARIAVHILYNNLPPIKPSVANE